MNYNKPVRFRADPEIIRVGIRKNSKDNTYTANVSFTDKYINSDEPIPFWFGTKCTADDPVNAVMMALKKVPPFIKGIDLEMEWTYDHPQRQYASEHPDRIYGS